MTPRYLTPADVAEQLQCSTRTVRRLIELGALRATRVSPRIVRVRAEDMEAYMRGARGGDRTDAA